MQPQAIEFMTWLGMTYAGALIALPIMELVRKKIDGCDYQKLLDACAEKDKDDYAIFLMAAFGTKIYKKIRRGKEKTK